MATPRKPKKVQICAQVDETTLSQARGNCILKHQSLSEYICDALRWQVNHDNRRLVEKKELYTGKASLYEIELDSEGNWRKKQ